MTDKSNIDVAQTSSYLRYLPAPLQNGRFIGRFLLAFEAILTGIPSDDMEGPQGLSDTLDQITRYVQPRETPADFLPWLARWVAVDLRDDWSVRTQRKVVASIVPLYKYRGTCIGIEGIIRLCVGGKAKVKIDDNVQDDTTGKPYPYYFQVTLTVDAIQTPATMQQLYRKLEAAIELQKPAQTYYSIVLEYSSLILLGAPDPLGKGASAAAQTMATRGIYVGRNTILGSVNMDPQTGEKSVATSLTSND